MDAILMTRAAPSPAAPVPVADLRPTADAAAIARNPIPHIPMPVPASIRQSATVAELRLAESGRAAAPEADVPVERILKPYGVTMLPYVPLDPAISATRTPEGDDLTATPARQPDLPATV